MDPARRRSVAGCAAPPEPESPRSGAVAVAARSAGRRWRGPCTCRAASAGAMERPDRDTLGVSKAMKVAAIQMTSGPEVAQNLEQARALLEEAAERGARLAALPEDFCFMGLKDADKRAVAEADGHGPVQDFLAATARRLQLWIVGGTIPLAAGADGRVAAA